MSEFHDLQKYRRAKDLPKTLLQLVSAETILQCAREQKAPCRILTHPITGEIEYLFYSVEIKEWIEQNLLRVQQGMKFVNLQLLNTEKHLARSSDNVPYSLSAVRTLYRIDTSIYTGSGIYFLCKDGDIKYIGKSVCVSARIGAHLTERSKDFSEIFFIPAPTTEIDDLEKAFIHYFLPEYNAGTRGKLTTSEREVVESMLSKQPEASFT